MLTIQRDGWEERGVLKNRNGLPRCPRCDGALIDDSDYTITAVRCVSCGWRKYGSFATRQADDPVKRCACGNVIEKTGRKIQTVKCDECLKLWRIECGKMLHTASRKWRNG